MPGPAESDRAVPNLPSRDFDATEAFYAGFGFDRTFRNEGWMIITRGGLQLEFFPYPTLDPATEGSELLDPTRLAPALGIHDRIAVHRHATGVGHLLEQFQPHRRAHLIEQRPPRTEDDRMREQQHLVEQPRRE